MSTRCGTLPAPARAGRPGAGVVAQSAVLLEGCDDGLIRARDWSKAANSANVRRLLVVCR
jgi:hypothetical protein